MADTDYSPLEPQQEQPPPSPTQGVKSGLADQWRGFLSDPSSRAFLIQAGLSMLQPRPVGQTSIGHIASGLGQGGEAAARVQAGEEHRTEAESVQRARAAGSEAKLQVADAALQRAAASQMNADTRRMIGSSATPTSMLNVRAKAQGAFNKWVMDKPDILNPEDPYLDALGVTSKKEAATKFGSDPAFRARVYEVFGGLSRGAPTATAPGGGPQVPEETRTVNGKTYFKLNGQWYEQ